MRLTSDNEANAWILKRRAMMDRERNAFRYWWICNRPNISNPLARIKEQQCAWNRWKISRGLMQDPKSLN